MSSSPSTNPSSCDSAVIYGLPSCSAEPSENQEYTNSLDVSSPALGQAVPGNDANLPESTGPKILMNTDMANQAAEDLASGKARNVKEWYEQYMRKKAEDERQQNVLQQVIIANQEEQPKDEKEDPTECINPKKRKMDNIEPGPSSIKSSKVEEESLVYETIGELKQTPADPLRKMEMMANSSNFQPSNKISQTIVESQSKRDRKHTLDTANSQISFSNSHQPIEMTSRMQHTTSSPSASAQSMPHSPYPYSSYSPMVPPVQFPPIMYQGVLPPGGPPPPMIPMAPNNMRIQQYQYHMWQMHQKMMASNRGGQMSPFPGPMPPPFPSSGFPSHMPSMPGPLSGPIIPQPLNNKMPMTPGPLTAPTGPMQMPSFPLMMCSPFPSAGQPSPMSMAMSRPDSNGQPIFSFSMNSAEPDLSTKLF